MDLIKNNRKFILVRVPPPSEVSTRHVAWVFEGRNEMKGKN